MLSCSRGCSQKHTQAAAQSDWQARVWRGAPAGVQGPVCQGLEQARVAKMGQAASVTSGASGEKEEALTPVWGGADGT